jgi:hypothetical protein
MDVAVIELDRDAPSATSRPPTRLLRALGLALAAVLTLGLGGAGPARSVRWERVGVLNPADEDTVFLLSGDRLYTVATGPDGRRITTAWSAGTLAELWSTGTDQPESPGAVPGGINLTAADDGLLLTGPSYATAMIDGATGTVRWTEHAPVQAVGDGLGVTQETHFRAGTEYDQDSGAPGDLYWSSTGQPHTEPPRRTTVFGIDLHTGRRLWADDERGSVRAVPVPGDAGRVVVAASDQLVLREARTGEVLGRAELPHTRGVSWVEAAGGLLLVRQGRMEYGGTVAAYEMGTLRRLWQTGVPPDDGRRGTCHGLPCRRDGSGVAVLDPRTGDPRWRADPGVDLTVWADGVLELDSENGGPIRLVDRDTGTERVPLRRWHGVVPDAGGRLLLSRVEADFSGTTFGMLRPGGSRVQPLGSGPASAQDCTANGGYVACRTGDGITVWTYRA